jgi:hypothetical protein
VIPLGDDVPTHRVPVMTYALTVISVAVWIFVQGGGTDPQRLAATICTLGMVPGDLTGAIQTGAIRTGAIRTGTIRTGAYGREQIQRELRIHPSCRSIFTASAFIAPVFIFSYVSPRAVGSVHRSHVT